MMTRLEVLCIAMGVAGTSLALIYGLAGFIRSVMLMSIGVTGVVVLLMLQFLNIPDLILPLFGLGDNISMLLILPEQEGRLMVLEASY